MVKIKLLILLPGNALFGQEQALIGVAVALRRTKVESHFLVHGGWGGEIAKHLDTLGFGCTELPLGSIWSLSIFRSEKGQVFRNIQGLLKTSFALRKIIKNFGATHLLTGNTSFTAYLLPTLYWSRIKVIYRHGDDAADHSTFHRVLNRLIFWRTNLHVANCQYLKNQLFDKYALRMSHVIYNCPVRFGDDRLEETVNSPNQVAGPIRVLYVGQLSEHKGVFLLFSAFREVAAEYPNLILDIVGDPPGVGSAAVKSVDAPLKELIATYPNRVLHHGFLSDPFSMFKAADVHIIPSIWQDPSPNVVFEAKSCGVPSVGFKVGGVPELIEHKVDGYICANKDTESLATAIEWMVSDLERLVKLKQAAMKNYIANFGLERFRKQWLELLSSTVISAKTPKITSK